jgi:hypothetical protein
LFFYRRKPGLWSDSDCPRLYVYTPYSFSASMPVNVKTAVESRKYAVSRMGLWTGDDDDDDDDEDPSLSLLTIKTQNATTIDKIIVLTKQQLQWPLLLENPIARLHQPSSGRHALLT